MNAEEILRLHTYRDELLQAVRNHSYLERGAAQRRKLYEIMGRPALAWLELIAARKVISIYEDGIPEEWDSSPFSLQEIETERAAIKERYSDPVEREENLKIWDEESIPTKLLSQRMTEIAEGVLRGTFPKSRADFLTNNHYHNFSASLAFAQNRGVNISYPTECAYYAAHSALSTACGYDPLFRVARISSGDKPLILQSSDAAKIDSIKDIQWRSGRDMSDLELTMASSADAAAYALVALAAEPTLSYEEAQQNKLLAPNRVLEYWEWWLTDALNQAVDTAHQT